ncbi:serine hydrolase domain-containing protein [Pedobacter sp. JY14-1]|uniref:serine hydrolase domain-containing protein n=1 Tax=Pedobacter sp. JY14-1 TaxID=3034151 RepID=UPI0023E20964|nr:serine hydrolase domain-containing protein [Pedobacter sp. JY14-1]
MQVKASHFYCSVIYCLLFHVSLRTEAQKTERLDSLFNAVCAESNFSGSVLVAEDGLPMYQKTMGYANFATKQPVTRQTMFELASVSKQFTAMAIMQLEEKKKLSYTDSLEKFFPGFPYRGITVQHLLTHTSGIPEFLGWGESRIDTGRINYNRDILESMIKHPLTLNFRPGEQMSYSNTNYVLLALIVEKASGMPFGKYLQHYIFVPLGMDHTRVYAQRADQPKIKDYAYGHIYDGAKGKFVINDLIQANRFEYVFDGISGPYGISSTTQDLLKWDQALYSDKLINKAGQEKAYQPFMLSNGAPAALMGTPYGFGWLLMPSSEFSGKSYMHSGGYPGYMNIIVRYAEKKKTIILLSNVYNVINIYQLASAIESILFDRPFDIPRSMPFKKSIVLSPEQLKLLEGTYSLVAAPTVSFSITSYMGQVYAQLTGQPKVEIYPASETDFFYTVVTARIKFYKDAAGAVNRLVLFQNGKEVEARRM